MRLADIKAQMRVVWIPPHAYGNIRHPHCEVGRVSTVDMYCAYVRFDSDVQKVGWEHAPSIAIPADELQEVHDDHKP